MNFFILEVVPHLIGIWELQLTPKIRGWANYHRHMASGRTFEHVDHVIFHALRRWGSEKTSAKISKPWLKKKYFEWHKGLDWCFFGETFDGDGQLIKIRLQRTAATPIKRHIKVKGEANPYVSAARLPSGTRYVCRS